MIEQKRHRQLFASPLFEFHFPEHEALNAALLEEGAALRAASEGAKKSNRGGWHSKGNLFDNPAASIKVLRALAIEAVEIATKQCGARADLSGLALKLYAWMNANPRGGFNAPHTHPGAHWSGVYYVSQPKVDKGTSGKIEFLDPRSDLPDWRILDAPTFLPQMNLRPQPGDMILFPSYLMHWVYPNEAEEDRVTVAFNATFRKAGKKKAG